MAEKIAAGATMTAGELIEHLSRFDPSMPVTVGGPVESELTFDWLNIDGATDPSEDQQPSVILMTRDDFDTRQF